MENIKYTWENSILLKIDDDSFTNKDTLSLLRKMSILTEIPSIGIEDIPVWATDIRRGLEGIRKTADQDFNCKIIAENELIQVAVSIVDGNPVVTIFPSGRVAMMMEDFSYYNSMIAGWTGLAYYDFDKKYERYFEEILKCFGTLCVKDSIPIELTNNRFGISVDDLGGSDFSADNIVRIYDEIVCSRASNFSKMTTQRRVDFLEYSGNDFRFFDLCIPVFDHKDEAIKMLNLSTRTLVPLAGVMKDCADEIVRIQKGNFESGGDFGLILENDDIRGEMQKLREIGCKSGRVNYVVTAEEVNRAQILRNSIFVLDDGRQVDLSKLENSMKM